MAKIYLSSTYSDLKEHREAVYHALRKMRHNIITMEDYVATDQRPLDKCLADVRGSDLYIGLFAWRYGYIPLENNPEQKSITELEYRTALNQGKPTLLFLLDENALWSPKWMDSQTGEGNVGALILALRQELLRDKLVSTFQGKEDIANVVIHAVHDWEKRSHLNTATDPLLDMRTKYLEQVYQRYSSVKLPIGSSQGLSLHAIFQPLTLHRDPLVVESLTRDKRRVLLGETSEEYERRRGSDARDDIYPTAQEVTAENAEEALKKSHQRRMVVLGGPGTGKTTTLKYLAARQAKEVLESPDLPVPIYLSLAALARSGKPLQRYLLDIVEDMEVDPAYAALLWHDMQHGQAYVCLDSLDEVDPKMRTDMIDLVNRKAQEPGNTWIVGSRFTEYKGGQFKAGQFSEWEIQPMSAALRQELACKLFPELHRCLDLTQQELPTAQTFVSLLEQHPRASAWGENPLLFSLAAVVFLKQGRLPASRVLLYHYVIEAVLATREVDPIRRKILLRILTELALWVHQQRGRTFTEDDLISFFMEDQRRSWGETNDLTHAVINSGIVEIVARQTYGFRHQTFQEYLAAFELARRLAGTDAHLHEQTDTFIWAKHTYSRWTEVLRMMVGILIQNHGANGLRKASQWIEKLTQQRTSEEGDPGFLSFSLALVAVSELGEIPEWQSAQTVKLEIALLETWFDELMLAAQRGQDQKRRRLVALANEIRHFQESSVASIFEKIVASVRHKFRSVRETCVDLLGKLGPRSVVVLLRILLDRTFVHSDVIFNSLEELKSHIPVELLVTALQDEDSFVRRIAVEALGKLGERAPIEPLIAALQDEDSDMRGAAAEALGELGERVLIEPLIAALQDEDSFVRRIAVEALGKLGERVPIEPLIAALQDEDSDMRGAAARALGKLGVRVPIEPLIAALQDENSDVRSAAARALGKLGVRVPIEPLIAALQDEDSDVRGAAAEALVRQGKIPIEDLHLCWIGRSLYLYCSVMETLGNMRERAPIEPLVAALQDETSRVRSAAAEALGKLGERAPVEPLVAALQDEQLFVRSAAVEALGELGERAPIEPLVAALQDETSRVRSAAAEALGKLGERVPIEPLVAALQDETSRVRSAAAEALGKLGERAPIEPLVVALQDKDSFVRSAAAEALGELGERAPIEPLVAALQDKDSFVRSAAAEALGELRERVPVDLLIAALQDKDSDVRSAAAEALGELGDRAPIEPLMAALQDEQLFVRSAAVEALGKLGDRAPIEPLVAALQDEISFVRSVAARALGKLGERAPIEPLVAALQDEDSFVRSAAAGALGEMGERAPIEPLIAALQDEQLFVRSAAVEALGKLGDRAPVDPILTTLQDEYSDVRSAATEALGNLGDRVPLDTLLEALQDEDSEVRSNAIRIIQQREPEALQPLSQEALALLQGDPPGPIFNSIAYSFLADTLGNMGIASPAILEQLTELLQWPYWQVRMNAAQALGKIRRNIPDEAIRQLLLLQRDKDPRNRAVQKAADDALAEILSLETGIEDD